ncbi:hypothetical protein QJ850_gp542 [Acanthamoeba polyphaga mimivirus]|uniref:Uncharacterized protein n=1 Tax=Acanthamoeba polyphaga mimivirus Kroon TaxID=3069720 RepID=A0A0G2Y8L9_9VIRU|nr:hypothetical protein QJ850_gp542 [Acanthamoeba polyphaga mimivirus]AKI80157.1 hypothetical protein [Acanthamoeba polyphaga mimivirus Kroon]
MKNDYQFVTYNKKNYYVFRYVKTQESEKLFIIDEDDFDIIMSTGLSFYGIHSFIGHNITINDEQYTAYLHDYIVRDGDISSLVYHINHNTHDNRKVNLISVPKDEIESYQPKYHRTIKLPKKCGINENQIPKFVNYISKTKKHSDKFVFKMNIIGRDKPLIYQSSESKDISTFDKYVQIVEIILKLNNQYPEYFINKGILENYSDNSLQLMKEYNEIISLTSYDCVKKNIMDIPKKFKLESLMSKASVKVQQYLETVDLTKKTGKNIKSNLPKGCGITLDMIPKHCYYRPANEKTGDSFRIDRKHPAIVNGKELSTTSKKKISTKDKFDELIKLLETLDNKH